MSTRKIVICGLGAAITLLLTIVIVMPIAGMGYVNFGDSSILLFATFLNPVAAFFVGGVGSALADISLGYTQYAIFTFIIKGCEGLVVAYLFKKLSKNLRIIAFVVGITIMIGGYYITDVILIGNFIAVLPAVQGNVVQGVVCCIVATITYKPFLRIASKQIKTLEE